MNSIIANVLVATLILALLTAAVFVTVRQRKNESCGCSSNGKRKCSKKTKEQGETCSKGCSGCPYSRS